MIGLIQTQVDGLHNPFDSDQTMNAKVIQVKSTPTTHQKGIEETDHADAESDAEVRDKAVGDNDEEVLYEGDVSVLDDILEQEISIASPTPLLINGNWKNYSVGMLRTAPHASLSPPQPRSTGVPQAQSVATSQVVDDSTNSCSQKKNVFSRRRPRIPVTKEVYHTELVKQKVEALKNSMIQASEEHDMKKQQFQITLQLEKEKLKQEVLKTRLIELEVLEKEQIAKSKHT